MQSVQVKFVSSFFDLHFVKFQFISEASNTAVVRVATSRGNAAETALALSTKKHAGTPLTPSLSKLYNDLHP